MKIPVPGFIWSSVLIGSYAALQALTNGMGEFATEWWQPAAVAFLAAGAKALDIAIKKIARPTVGSRDLQKPRSAIEQFFLG